MEEEQIQSEYTTMRVRCQRPRPFFLKELLFVGHQVSFVLVGSFLRVAGRYKKNRGLVSRRECE